MSTIGTYENRPVRASAYTWPVFLCPPSGPPRSGLTFAEALRFPAKEGWRIAKDTSGSPTFTLASCDEGFPGVWYVPICWTVAP